MKTLFCDIDGTILNETGLYSKQDILAIKEFRKAGHKFILCTGRNINEVDEVINSFNIPYDYLVLSNGAQIVDNRGNYLLNQKIAYETGKELIEYIQDHFPWLFVSFFNDKVTYGKRKDKEYIMQDNQMMPTANTIFEREYLRGLDFAIIACFNPDGTTKDILAIQDYIKRAYPQLESQVNQIHLDITVKGYSKGTGAKLIINTLGSKDSYCIGDSFNDITMMKTVNNPYTFNRVLDDIKIHTRRQVNYVHEMIAEILEAEDELAR